MLLTFEDPPSNIKAGWKEHHNVFMNELKNLTATGMTSLGSSLKHSFDLLNLNRMQTGIDTYGLGRSPFYVEPSIIIVITDGGRLSSASGVQEELTLPMHSSVPGSELTKEPFRWDQRLFALVLRLTGMVPSDNNSNNNINGGSGLLTSDASPINDMCDVTGGCSYSVSSQRSLMQCLENVVNRIQGGVVIHFEKIPASPDPVIPNMEVNDENNSRDNVNGFQEMNNEMLLGDKSWTSCRRLIYVQRSAAKGYSIGHWPIPEAFWPDLNMPSLPPRSAHPVVKFSCLETHPLVIENMPFDKYELEPCSLTRVILALKNPLTAWQCFINNSSKSGDMGFPFGYLKASTNLSCVNLFVLPYNYPVLLPLLDDLLKVHQLKPSREWKMAWDVYLKNLPYYYAAPLKKALQRMGAPINLVPESMENFLSYPVQNHLKRVKLHAKTEFDKLVSSVGSYAAKAAGSQTEVIRINTTPSSAFTSIPSSSSHQKKICDIALAGNTSHPRIRGIEKELNEFPNFVLRVKDKTSELKSQSYRNPYDISRREIIDQIHRMRINFFLPPSSIKYQDEDQIHSLPVAQMGNYQEYLKRIPSPLRELDPTPVRQHMFGNPFKIDKKGVMVDETDIDLVGSGGSSPGSPGMSGQRLSSKRSADRETSGRPKRRPGPLPKNYTRPLSPSLGSPASQTPPASPALSVTSENIDVSSDVEMEEDVVEIEELAVMAKTAASSTPPESPSPISAADDINSMFSDDKETEISFIPDGETNNQPSYNTAPSRQSSLTSLPSPLINGIAGLAALANDCVANKEIVNGNNLRQTLSAREIELRRELFNLVKKPGKGKFCELRYSCFQTTNLIFFNRLLEVSNNGRGTNSTEIEGPSC
jgi:integrator complex subunit 6